MEFILDNNTLVLLSLIGLVAGFIDAIAGGGGMLTIPALLTAGIPPHLALGTNKLSASFGSLAASLAYYQKKLFSPRFWKTSIISTAVGAVIGTICVYLISAQWLTKAIPIIIIFVALYSVFFKNHFSNEHGLPDRTPKLRKTQIYQGTLLGFYDGFAGPGTGAFWLTSNLYLYKMNVLLSSGLAKTNNFVSNITALLTFMYLGQVDYLIGVLMGVFIMIGSWIGAHSAIKFGAGFIRPIFSLTVIALSCHLAYSAWF